MVDIPERFGGLAGDKTTSLLLAEANSLMGSWSVTFAAHVGIGTLPIAWFGTEAQKAKWLPKLATGELVAAYALTEQGSGSDALGAKTRAVKSPDGKSWVLNGSKLYITNAAFADVFIVFAKVDGENFTGFVVENGTPGFTVGPEEHKMGIRGSSTCPLYLEDARIPVENLLGEIGKGHKIAFNILNLGRLKLGAGVLGGMKLQFANALKFAEERKQFKTPVAKFPLTREKLARMAGSIFADRVDDLPDDGAHRCPARDPDGRRRGRGEDHRGVRGVRDRGVDHEGDGERGARPRWWTTRCRSTAGRASSRSTRWSGRTATRASTASSRGRTRSTGCSSPGCCSSAR